METSGDESGSGTGEVTTPVDIPMDIPVEKPATNTEEEFFEESAQPQEAETTEHTDESIEQRSFSAVNRGGFR